MTVSVRHLTKRYGRTCAVRDVSFEAHPGTVTAFLGPNGAGKSTTLRTVVGLDRPTAGQALIDGRDYADIPAPLHAVGALLDGASAHRRRTARNHLRWIAATHAIGLRRIEQVLDLTGLTPVADRKVGGFSLGMTQRLGVAAALLGDPATLILDEPVNGLDPDGVRWIRDLLRSLAAEGRTVLLSSHLLGEASLVADRVVVIGRGRILADAPLGDLVTSRRLVRVRTSAPDSLVALVAADGVTSRTEARGVVEFEGLSSEHLAERAAAAGIPLYEIGEVTRTLEQAYEDLTRGEIEYAAGRETSGEPLTSGGRRS